MKREVKERIKANKGGRSPNLLEWNLARMIARKQFYRAMYWRGIKNMLAASRMYRDLARLYP